MESVYDITNELYNILVGNYVVSYGNNDKSIIDIPCYVDNREDIISIWWGNEYFVCYPSYYKSLAGSYKQYDIDGIISYLDKHNCYRLAHNTKKAISL